MSYRLHLSQRGCDRCKKVSSFFIFVIHFPHSAQSVKRLPWWSGHLGDTVHIIPTAAGTFSESGPPCAYWRMLTKAPLFHVYMSFPWQWKAGDTVTANEERTSHPIGFSVYLESRPHWQKQHKISGNLNEEAEREETCVSICLFRRMTNDLLLLSFHALRE